jgi:hypothetical protein
MVNHKNIVSAAPGDHIGPPLQIYFMYLLALVSFQEALSDGFTHIFVSRCVQRFLRR